jgi:hypothetical protein
VVLKPVEITGRKTRDTFKERRISLTEKIHERSKKAGTHCVQ